jgi:hypothetical protein
VYYVHILVVVDESSTWESQVFEKLFDPGLRRIVDFVDACQEDFAPTYREVAAYIFTKKKLNL